MAISKILVIVASVIGIGASAMSAQAYTKHSSGRTYEIIAKCLVDELGMKEDIDFRKNPATTSVQLSDGARNGDFRGREAEIDECFQKPATRSTRNERDDDK